MTMKEIEKQFGAKKKKAMELMAIEMSQLEEILEMEKDPEEIKRLHKKFRKIEHGYISIRTHVRGA